MKLLRKRKKNTIKESESKKRKKKKGVFNTNANFEEVRSIKQGTVEKKPQVNKEKKKRKRTTRGNLNSEK